MFTRDKSDNPGRNNASSFYKTDMKLMKKGIVTTWLLIYQVGCKLDMFLNRVLSVVRLLLKTVYYVVLNITETNKAHTNMNLRHDVATKICHAADGVT